MNRRSLKRDSHGQVLVITSLLVALLLLSTGVYVIEIQKNQPIISNQTDNVFLEYQQSIKNTLISALANVTGGGDQNILSADLNEVNAVMTAHSYQAMLQMDYTPLNAEPYQNGFWISSGTNGVGVSSVYVTFAFNSSGFSADSNFMYSLNVTSQVTFSGTCLQLNDTSKQVTLTINVLNEGKPALAQNFNVYYQNDTGWVAVEQPSLSDFGNGTYQLSFNADSDQSINPLFVSLICQDQRGISVGANATCTVI